MRYEEQDFSTLETRYASVERFIEKICAGSIRSMIVSGPPGVGKTYSIEQFLRKYSTEKYKVVTGHMSMLSLYGNLYSLRNSKNVLVLDDIDSVFEKIEGLNILKAAMDTKAQRQINWESSTPLLAAMNVPPSFSFNGAVILITNEGRGNMKKKLAQHLAALCDRTFQIKVADTSRESLLHQINFMILKKGLLSSFNFDEDQIFEILDYINDNAESITHLSLRTAVKLAELVEIDSAGWQQWAGDGLLTENA